jgi:hypothetical protein
LSLTEECPSCEQPGSIKGEEFYKKYQVSTDQPPTTAKCGACGTEYSGFSLVKKNIEKYIFLT